MQNKITSVDVFFRLVKIRLSLTVTFSAVTGYLLAPNPDSHSLFIVIAGVLSLASGSSALNQVEEQKIDILMERTKHRPLPSGEMTPFVALIISFILILTGTLLLSDKGWLPALLGLITVILYNFIYTSLKRISVLSIFPGALVGAVCPLIGWTASGSTLFHPSALFVAIFVFLWQVPHFYLLLLQYSNDYKKAGIPGIFDLMSDFGIKVLIFIWIVLTSIFLSLFPLFQLNIKPSLIPFLVLLNLSFIILFYKFLFKKKSDKPIRLAFILINSFVVVVFIILILGRL